MSSKISELKTSIESTARVIDQDEGDQLWRTRFGEYWFPAGTGISRLANYIAEQQAGIYTPNEPPLKTGGVILDCGANIGTFSMRCFQYNPKLVISVEPAPGNLSCLTRNLASEVQEALEGSRETIRKFRPTLLIAVEHGKDLIANARAVIDLVRDIRADYTWDCPFCEEMGRKFIFPDVLVFQ